MATPSKRRCAESDPPNKKPHIVKKSFMSMDAYTRHKFLISHYKMTQPGSTSTLNRNTSKDKTDHDVLREYHKFLWDDEDEDNESVTTDDQWGRKVAKAYYDKLFKEYCICDLTYYKENKVAMRWRTESEVVAGKGQFICGEKHCKEKHGEEGCEEGLKSWEVNFAYLEGGTKKNALVKLRLCTSCSKKLNYHHKKKEVKRESTKRKKNSSQSSSKLETSGRDVNDYLNELLQ